MFSKKAMEKKLVVIAIFLSLIIASVGVYAVALRTLPEPSSLSYERPFIAFPTTTALDTTLNISLPSKAVITTAILNLTGLLLEKANPTNEQVWTQNNAYNKSRFADFAASPSVTLNLINDDDLFDIFVISPITGGETDGKAVQCYLNLGTKVTPDWKYNGTCTVNQTALDYEFFGQTYDIDKDGRPDFIGVENNGGTPSAVILAGNGTKALPSFNWAASKRVAFNLSEAFNASTVSECAAFGAQGSPRQLVAADLNNDNITDVCAKCTGGAGGVASTWACAKGTGKDANNNFNYTLMKEWQMKSFDSCNNCEEGWQLVDYDQDTKLDWQAVDYDAGAQGSQMWRKNTGNLTYPILTSSQNWLKGWDILVTDCSKPRTMAWFGDFDGNGSVDYVGECGATDSGTGSMDAKTDTNTIWASNVNVSVGHMLVWNNSATFNTVNLTAEFNGSLTAFLNNCTSVGGNCTVPLNFHSATRGQIKITLLNITWATIPTIQNQATIPTTGKVYNTFICQSEIVFQGTGTGLYAYFNVSRPDGTQLNLGNGTSFNSTFWNSTSQNTEFYNGTWTCRVTTSTDNAENTTSTWTIAVNNLPPYFENNRTSLSTSFGKRLNFNVSILDRDNNASISSAYINISSPNGTNYLTMSLMSNLTNVWNSTNFLLDQTGTWTARVQANDTSNEINITNFTFSVTDSVTYAPLTQTLYFTDLNISQLLNISISHDSDQTFVFEHNASFYNLTAHNLTFNSIFDMTKPQQNNTVQSGQTNYTTINITFFRNAANITYFANISSTRSFNNRTYWTNLTLVFVNTPPRFDSNGTNDTVFFGKTLQFNISVYDWEGNRTIDSVWANVTMPNGTQKLTNHLMFNRTLTSWNTTGFLLDKAGEWNVTIWANDTHGADNVTRHSFRVTDIASVNPASQTLTLDVNATRFVNITISHDSDQTFRFQHNFSAYNSTALNLTLVSIFNLGQSQEFQMVGVNQTNYTTLNITVNSLVANITYYFNVTSTRLFDNMTFNSTFVINVRQNPADIRFTTAPVSTITMFTTGSEFSSNYTVQNQGQGSASGCQPRFNGLLANKTYISFNDTGFSLTQYQNRSFFFTVDLPSETGTRADNVIVNCTTLGVEVTSLGNPLFTLTTNSPPQAGDGGGGGGGGVSLNITIIGNLTLVNFTTVPANIDSPVWYFGFVNPIQTLAVKNPIFGGVVKSSRLLRSCQVASPFSCEVVLNGSAVVTKVTVSNDRDFRQRYGPTFLTLISTQNEVTSIPVAVSVTNWATWFPITPFKTSLPEKSEWQLIFKIHQGQVFGIRAWWVVALIIVITTIVLIAVWYIYQPRIRFPDLSRIT